MPTKVTSAPPALSSPAISVVVPAFNAGSTIACTLQAILGQTVLPAEIVVVDDGSTDDTVAVARRLNDGRIRIISQRNSGVSAARNRGWLEAHSELIAFCDADDSWAPAFLETIAHLAAVYPRSVVYATSYRIIRPDAPSHDTRLIGSTFQGEEGIIADYFGLASKSDPPISSSSVAVWRWALHQIGGFPVGVASGEDLLTWARLATIGHFAYSRSSLSELHCPARLDFSRTSDPHDAVGRELVALVDSAPVSMRPSIRQYIGRWHEMRSIIALGQQNASRARHHAVRSVRNSGVRLRTVLLLALACLPSPIAFPIFSWARSGVISKRARRASSDPARTPCQH